METRISCAIALFRPPTKDVKTWSVLLGKRRITMYFSTFFNFITTQIRRLKVDDLTAIFNLMSLSEKNLILSGDFNSMWNHLYFNNFKKKASSNLADSKDIKSLANETYYKALHNKYYTNYHKMAKNETSIQLINMSILKSQVNVEPQWVVPRGKLEKGESHLECAMREFKEETNISPESYEVISSDISKFVFNDQHINKKYQIVYFIAIEKVPTVPKILAPNEIVELKFTPVEFVQHLNAEEHLANIIKKMYTSLKKYKQFIKNVKRNKKTKNLDTDEKSASEYM
jgi:8-oxo-dGTP pyrophosphatase MutT (NUDIX family)